MSSAAIPVQDEAIDQPRGSLQRRVVLWTLGLVIAATLISALWLGDIARRSLSDSHVRTCELLAQTLAAAFAGSIEDGHWTSNADQVLDGLSLDPRVAFVAVTDSSSHTIYQHTFDPLAYAGFAEVALAFDGKYIEPSEPIELSDGSTVVARKTPIWNPPKGIDERAHSGLVRELDGFVVLAMRDRRIGEAQTQMQLAQLGAAGMVCLISLPLVVWSVRRWTGPLLALVRATADLALGRQPTTVPPAGNDELGLLTQRFNDMASHLLTARNQLQQANAQLEAKVRQRTAELEKLNLRLQSEMRDKEEFLRAVSHDLGAPLRNIAGLSDLLVRKHHDDLAQDVLNKLQRITSNAHQQTEMINDLLEISRIHTRPGEKQMVETEALLREIADNLAYDLEQKGIELKIDSPLPAVFAERNRLRQVFQNLIDNAIKYMVDEGEKRISIRAQQTPTDVTFYVADTGRGIDPRDLDQVFQVFRRATHSGTHSIPGRGVGLASVKSIIQTHGGDIRVQSTPGQGSTFIFTLPAAPGA
ncbi:MAG: HAMP domain-containing histidine kinase [Phycisphaeraceae bacterium]|nr:HAMP domain-containing histidine kinase [Phycisphaeraceae bacterium]